MATDSYCVCFLIYPKKSHNWAASYSFCFWFWYLFSFSPSSPLSLLFWCRVSLARGFPTRGGGEQEEERVPGLHVSPNIMSVQGTHQALSKCWLSPSLLSLCQSSCGLLAPPDYSVHPPTPASATSPINLQVSEGKLRFRPVQVCMLGYERGPFISHPQYPTVCKVSLSSYLSCSSSLFLWGFFCICLFVCLFLALAKMLFMAIIIISPGSEV